MDTTMTDSVWKKFEFPFNEKIHWKGIGCTISSMMFEMGKKKQLPFYNDWEEMWFPRMESGVQQPATK